MIGRRLAFAAALAALGGCAIQPHLSAPASAIDVQILAINDFHGNIERSAEPIRFELSKDQFASARAGGAASLGEELKTLRSGCSQTITVAAGDLVGASPLTSAYFLDEPTIDAMNMIGLSLASVGNHEFDKGSGELLRKQTGGCAKFTGLTPCRLEPFKGATFEYLSANVVKADGHTLFPATAVRQFGPITIGFIGMTLKETGTLVTPTGVAGLRFTDEAATANALVPALQAEGADAIVLLIHQGGKVPDLYHVQDCEGLSGDILPILDKLSPAITTIVSGHTHNAYVCEVESGGTRRLLTSAGKYGYFVSDLRLDFDPDTHRLLSQSARNVPIIREGAGDPAIAALVKRYSDGAAPAAARVVGHLSGVVSSGVQGDRESPAADLIADAQLAATKGPAHGNADLSFINTGGVRTDFVPGPDGAITYGQIFSIEPFGNTLIVKTYTGAQLKALLEQQFEADGKLRPSSLVPSANFHYAFDTKRPAGERITAMLLDGRPIDPAKSYRVTVNNFLASGGDTYTVFAQGTDAFDAGVDLDALEAWLATNPAIPTGGRIEG